MTYKNHALNNFLEALVKNSSPDEKIVRVGNLPDDADEKLKRLLLREVCLEINNIEWFCDSVRKRYFKDFPLISMKANDVVNRDKLNTCKNQ